MAEKNDSAYRRRHHHRRHYYPFSLSLLLRETFTFMNDTLVWLT